MLRAADGVTPSVSLFTQLLSGMSAVESKSFFASAQLS
jgi:hypothetical protein